MKTVILITVIESSAVMLAILYFYYKRSQSRKRALVFRRPDVSMTTLSFGRANGEGKKSKSKVDRGKRWFNSQPVKGGYKYEWNSRSQQ